MIGMNALQGEAQDLTLDEYRDMAEFFHQIRDFERRSETHAQALGMNPELHQLLLTIQGLPEGLRPTIASIAEQLCVSPQTVSALVDQAAGRMDLIRSSAGGDGTDDWVKLTRSGREALRRLVLVNRDELERSGPEIAGALQSIIKQRRRKGRNVA